MSTIHAEFVVSSFTLHLSQITHYFMLGGDEMRRMQRTPSWPASLGPNIGNGVRALIILFSQGLRCPALDFRLSEMAAEIL